MWVGGARDLDYDERCKSTSPVTSDEDPPVRYDSATALGTMTRESDDLLSQATGRSRVTSFVVVEV
ncbi:MAG TPA: hypothetical protein VHL58_20295, partial [Thermoanaerobaculia bacterium]|nr:hypothetical protein [Thermoanaerobaculia bacterium]